MKKIFILLTNIVLGAALVMGTSSCSEDFINETKRDAMSSDWLNEPEGLASMATYIPASTHNEAMLSGAWTSIAQ